MQNKAALCSACFEARRKQKKHIFYEFYMHNTHTWTPEEIVNSDKRYTQKTAYFSSIFVQK